MPRKDFRRHLEQASAGPLPQNLSQLQEGEDDGEFTFNYSHPGSSGGITLQATVSDVGDYPKSHTFFVFAVSETVPEKISRAIEDIGSVDSLTIESFVKLVAKKLNSSAVHTSNTSDEDLEMLEGDAEDDDDGFYDGDAANDDDDLDDFTPPTGKLPKPPTTSGSASATANNMSDREHELFQKRVRADLQEVKRAGFRFAHQGGLLSPGHSCYVMVSCRVAKLGIPEDAMKAWHLERNEYIMLLIHYPNGYKPMEEASRSWSSDRSVVNMHVAVTKRYKMSIAEAIEAFTQVESKKGNTVGGDAESAKEDTKTAVRPLFIGAALDDLLNGRLSALINYRQGLNLSWSGAESFYNDSQGISLDKMPPMDPKYYGEADFLPEQQIPSIVTSDHLADRTLDYSFPLVAMQFTLRHMVRCTDFCLVCWCKTGDEFEALRPYVCSKPLCLYQYMTLGFGPSIEFEILTQPYVADLLVSFCYVSAAMRALKDFPIGLGMNVLHPKALGVSPSMYSGVAPPTGLQRIRQSLGSRKATEASTAAESSGETVAATWDEKKSELRLKDGEGRPFKPGTWICFWSPGSPRRHCRITETWYPVVRHGTIIEEAKESTEDEKQSSYPSSASMMTPYNMQQRSALAAQNATFDPESVTISSGPAGPEEVSIAAYDILFDELSDAHKQDALLILLKTLPSVMEMRGYLQSKKKQGTLQAWTERITPAALSALRWIIASNRSCIVQPESLSGQKSTDEEEVYGMPDYQQFRFASGAPDKESRFIQCVRDTTKRLELKHPTLFAWHGSPIGNWHSIIRQGLHFDRVSHGRAFGDGVYHSLHCQVSQGYAMQGHGAFCWPSSQLKITSALSLNEIVNAPKEFTSSNPHLVVNNIDWIQSRYLFVKCKINPTVTVKPDQVLQQDPAMRPVGSINQPLVIPVNAISKSRRPIVKSVKSGADGQKRSRVSTDDQDNEDLVSELSDNEDIKVLSHEKRQLPLSGTLGDLTNKPLPLVPGMARKPVPEAKTIFTPGTLDYSKLPQLAAPSYATPQATRSLQREIKTVLKTQSSTPVSDLGWYLDPDNISNPYQLIFELHSFPLELPLAKDMKSQKVDSIVLECRFGPSFPFSPPFIRVIRPRFVPFLAGGGGHVTAGGAICMELLTNSGWNPSCGIEGVLLQVRMALMSTEPRPARLEKYAGSNNSSDYGVMEAVEAYRRACMTHGVRILSQSLLYFALALLTFSAVGSSSRFPADVHDAALRCLSSRSGTGRALFHPWSPDASPYPTGADFNTSGRWFPQ